LDRIQSKNKIGAGEKQINNYKSIDFSQAKVEMIEAKF